MSKKIAGITLEEVNNKALWVARFISGYREVGIYSEVVKYLDREDCKDIDFLRYDRQPEELKPFFDEMDQLTKSNSWMGLSELFEKFGKDDTKSEYPLGKDNMLKYVKAGNATITLRSGDTGVYYTYKICKHSEKNLWFVSLFTGHNNDEDYSYIAYFLDDNILKTSAKSKLTADAVPVKAFDYFMKHINNVPEKLSVFHSGKCCRCGRTLTTPESIQSGIGPECAKLVSA